MDLMPGTRVGSYEISSQLGAGGMGVVYRARDAKLQRDVALKVLPEVFASDPERLARFRREAQILASLNHPNIAAIYGLEEAGAVKALVLELVEGATLAECLEAGSLSPGTGERVGVRGKALPVEEALPIARQIAEALEAAHEAGVIHRDLKPANVKVRGDGTVKVLDFGLAKAFDPLPHPSGRGEGASQSPTLTTPAATRMGLILGTAAYMAPEQAKGRPIDRRADIWAFGCVLYEMLTGVRAFEGDDVSDTLAAVLRAEPKWDALVGVPARLVRLVRRCLEKHPGRRLQHIGDVRLEIQDAIAEPPEERSAASLDATRGRHPRYALSVALTALGTCIVTALIVWAALRPEPAPATPPIRLTMVTGAPLFPTGLTLALSPDGRTLFYVGQGDGGAARRLYRRSLDQLEALPLNGTDGAGTPFVSPDGQWVGFLDTREGALKKMPASGGPTVTLCKVTASRGASWSSDGTIVFGQAASGLMRVSAAGGEPQPLTSVPADSGEGHAAPHVLPGGNGILFEVSGLSILARGVAVYTSATGEVRRLVDGGRPHYVSSGHIVFERSGSLWAVPFNVDSLELMGEPFPVLEGVRVNNSVAAEFVVSQDGTLVYAARSAAAIESGVVWVDRDGKAGETIAEGLSNASYPRISPDGARLAIVAGADQGRSLWVYDLSGRPPIRLTSQGTPYTSVWTPDGRGLAFEYDVDPASAEVPIHAIAADGSASGPPEPLTAQGHHHPIGFTPDGRELIFSGNRPGSAWDVMAASVGAQSEPRPIVQTEHVEGFAGAALSGDGRWLAYVSDVTGRPEVWVRQYAEGGAPLRISPNGGVEPVWSRDGRELFYLEDDRMMAVEIRITPEFTFSAPKLLFEGRYAGRNQQPPSYDVATDGRFIMIKSAAAEMSPREDLVVVLGWLEELKRRAATQ